MGNKFKKSEYIYHAGLLIIALLVFAYIFNSKLDLNGDNCHYYINATSLAAGNGYCDMYGTPTANFPPGYPLLMAPLRAITSSFAAQKVMNLAFLFFGTLLLFAIMVREGMRKELAFIVSAAVLTTPHLLEFSTMMMSEASCFFFITLAFWSFLHISQRDSRSFWRSSYLYLFLFAVAFSLYIRTQAVVLVIAFSFGLLATRRWRLSLAVISATALAYSPWMLRNMFLGLGQSRYLGQLSFDSLGNKLKMLLVQALPESVVPYFDVNYMLSPSVLLWAVAAIMLLLIVYGVWQFKSLRFILYPFLACGVGIISIMDSPSLYRYLVMLLPFFTISLFAGAWHLMSYIWQRCTGRNASPWIMAFLLLPGFVQEGNSMFKHTLADIHESNSKDYPPLFGNCFLMARKVLELDRNAVVASRKPELLYLKEGVKGVPFIKFSDESEAIRYLIDCRVGYLIVDDIALSVTGNNLVPLINRNKEIFTVKSYLRNPDVFLFRFDGRKAQELLDRM